jgi:predicted dehydrogenase
VRIAVVGLGSIGRSHVRVLRQYDPDTEIIAVRSGRGGPVPEDDIVNLHVKSVAEALKWGPAGGIIASPAPYHIDQSLEFLRAGVPVLIEKPLAADYEDAKRLMHEEAIDPVALSRSAVGYVLRHQPAFDFVQETVERGRLGTLRTARAESRSYLPAWRPGQDYKQSVSARQDLGGGVFRELSHEINYVLELFGRCHAVTAWRNQGSEIDISVEEHVEMMVQHVGDAVTTISLDFATKAPLRRKLCATFSKGALTWNLVTNVVGVEVDGEEPVHREFPSERDDMFLAQLENFVDALSGQSPPKCTVEDGLKTMAVIDAAERSCVSRAWETV